MKRVVVTAVSFVMLVPAGLGVVYNGWFGQGVPVRVPSHATVLVDEGDQTNATSHTGQPIGNNHAHPETTHEHHADDSQHDSHDDKHHDTHHDKKGERKKDRPKSGAVPLRERNRIASVLLPTRSVQSKQS